MKRYNEHKRLNDNLETISNTKTSLIKQLYTVGLQINHMNPKSIDNYIDIETIELMIDQLHKKVVQTARLCI